ncbi:hypothetical protein JL722_1537 [Aureococcus anophagefferens]|nr:hypothetical protein JL722_1537 [Aureococcus anophagefferens]
MRLRCSINAWWLRRSRAVAARSPLWRRCFLFRMGTQASARFSSGENVLPQWTQTSGSKSSGVTPSRDVQRSTSLRRRSVVLSSSPQLRKASRAQRSCSGSLWVDVSRRGASLGSGDVGSNGSVGSSASGANSPRFFVNSAPPKPIRPLRGWCTML